MGLRGATERFHCRHTSQIRSGTVQLSHSSTVNDQISIGINRAYRFDSVEEHIGGIIRIDLERPCRLDTIFFFVAGEQLINRFLIGYGRDG